MKIIIAGGGKIGITLAHQLTKEGHDLTIIDRRTSVLEYAQDQFDTMTLTGNCASRTTLLDAGIREADLLIAADCTAFAYGDFHNWFMRDKITLVGCPKLDMVNYADKLTAIFEENDILSVTVVRMQVPCCGGLPFAVKTAIEASGKNIPMEVVVITPHGEILN